MPSHRAVVQAIRPAAAAALSMATLWGAVVPAPAEADTGSAERLVVGAVVHREEIGSLDVRFDGSAFLIPLDSFAELTGCTISSRELGAEVVTPLGPVELHDDELWISDGIVYLSDRVIREKLATEVEFDPASYALEFDLPWRPPTGPGREPRAEPAAATPDVAPPSATLSTLHADLRYTRIEDRDGFTGVSTLGGRLGGGYWRLRYEDDLAGHRQLRDYAWFTHWDNRVLLAGNQRVRLHPLLRSVELTGAQIGMTNQPLGRFSYNGTPREVLSRRMSPLQSFVGYGPAAGIAELRVNGVVVERQRLGLDGRYEFPDVAMPARSASRIEVRLYDRHDPSLPIEVHEEFRSASVFLVPDGALIQVGGAGREGNLIQQAVDDVDADGAVGFYQVRLGITDAFTVEAAAIGTESRKQLMAGLVSRVAPTAVISFGLGTSDGRFGYNLDLDVVGRRWRMVGRSLATESGFEPAYYRDRFDHFLEVGRTVGPRLDVALIGRSRRNADDRVEYVLPAVTWRPIESLWMRGRPDSEGEYRFDLSYRVDPWSRLNVSTVGRRAFMEYLRQLGDRYRLRLGTQFGDGRGSRQEAIVSGFGRGRLRPTWEAGALVTAGEPGVLLAGRIAIAPGLYARAQFESTSRVDDPDLARSDRLLVSLTADLGFSRGRVVAARTAAVRVDRGGLAGVVRLNAPDGFPRQDLGGLEILIDGHTAARTESSGAFFVGNLAPGVYRVELSPDNLPIELSPDRAEVVARVAGAAVTRVDLAVRPEFGIAGRVRDASGRPLADVVVEVVDVWTSFRRAAITDRFGLYRVDGLPIGSYVVRLSAESLPEATFAMPSRSVEIRDDFLFDQDLQLPSYPGEVGSEAGEAAGGNPG